MSTFVLEKRYALEMPSDYVDLNVEEMEYIEGGFIEETLIWVLGKGLDWLFSKAISYVASRATVQSVAIKAGIAAKTLAGLSVTGIVLAVAYAGYAVWYQFYGGFSSTMRKTYMNNANKYNNHQHCCRGMGSGCLGYV